MHKSISLFFSFLLFSILSTTAIADTEPDSLPMEEALQNLPWAQFRSVVEAIPKLKADVEAYGPLGWQFVQTNYSRYNWKKKIERLDSQQKNQLAELIANAHEKIPAMSGSGD